MEIRGNDEIDSVVMNVDFIPCRSTATKTCTEGDTLESLNEYLTYPELIIYHNQKRFDSRVFTEDCVISESRNFNQHIDKSQPNWMKTLIENSDVTDDIMYLDIGIEQELDLFSF